MPGETITLITVPSGKIEGITGGFPEGQDRFFIEHHIIRHLRQDMREHAFILPYNQTTIRLNCVWGPFLQVNFVDNQGRETVSINIAVTDEESRTLGIMYRDIMRHCRLPAPSSIPRPPWALKIYYPALTGEITHKTVIDQLSNSIIRTWSS